MLEPVIVLLGFQPPAAFLLEVGPPSSFPTRGLTLGVEDETPLPPLHRR